MPKYNASFALVVKPGGFSGFVQCVVTMKGERVRFATGCSRIREEDWDLRIQERRGSSLEALATNERLKNIRLHIEQAISEGKTLSEVRDLITGTEIVRKSKGIRSLYEQYLKARTDLAPATVRAFNASLKAFEAYEKATGDALDITSFHVGSQAMSSSARSPVKGITNWLLSEYGYNDNTTTKVLRHLISVVNWHVSEGLTGSIPVY